MAVKKAIVGMIVLVMLAVGTPLTVTSNAQGGCNREIARQESALRQFETDARRESLDFALDDARRAALGNLKNRLAGDPTADAAQEIRDRWDEWKEYVEQARSFQEVLADLSRCVNTAGATGCLKELLARNRTSDQLLARVNEATNKWIESLGNDTLNNVKDRVEKARSIMQNFTGRAGNLATGSAANAVENCFRDFEQRAQAQQRDPVDLRSSQPPSSPNVPQPPARQTPENTSGNSGNAASAGGGGGGMGAGSIVGLAAGGVGAAVGGKMLADYAEKQKCNQYETQIQSDMNSFTTAANNAAACSTQTCFNQRIPAVNNAISKMLATAGEWCTCLGPSASSDIPAADKAAVRAALSELRSLGVTSGTLPACFR